MATRIIVGDCRDVLETLPACSVNTIITSPPYYGLRSYLPKDHPDKWREIGSEPTLEEWVETIAGVMRQARRVLRDDGTLFLNLGDAHVSDGGPTRPHGGKAFEGRKIAEEVICLNGGAPAASGLRQKNLMGQPWRVAFALQADGWWWRDVIVWHKLNPMPESTRDRCTKAWEPILLFSKSATYFWNHEAMQEPAGGGAHPRRAKMPDGWDSSTGAGGHGNHHRKGREKGRVAGSYADGKSDRMGRGPGWRAVIGDKAEHGNVKYNASFDEAVGRRGLLPTRNMRNVWSFPTQGFKGAHFATFPEELPRRCLLAGCPVGGTVLDMFGGTGTVALEADRQHKHAVIIDLDGRNIPMAVERISREAPLFAQVEHG